MIGNYRLFDILRDYQKEDVINMKRSGHYYNTSDMGLGKTLETLSCIQELGAVPCLIICPKFALFVWQEEIRKWLGMTSVVYSGTPKQREQQWQEFMTKEGSFTDPNEGGCKFLITNYAMLSEILLRSGIEVPPAKTTSKKGPVDLATVSLKDNHTLVRSNFKFHWGAMIADEVHMSGIFNHKSVTYKLLLKAAKEIQIKYLLTGTPFRKGCVDLFGPLSILDYNRFDSYWGYVNKYCTIIQTPFGKEIERNPSNVKGFREMIKPYLIRRVKTDVLKELPGKLRQILYVEMNKEQRKVYDELTEKLIAEIPEVDDILITPNQMTLLMRQRQILACPQELGLKSRGAAIDAIVEHSHLRLDDYKPVVVFTPFRKALPYLKEAFKEEYPDGHIYEIRGQLTAEEFGAAWMGFQTDKYSQKILLCVIKSGASFQATVADTAYFLGYEWDFTLNEQAEDRLNRMGQQNFVNIYYVMTKGTVDEDVAMRLNEKKDSSDWVIGTDAQYLEKIRRVQHPNRYK